MANERASTPIRYWVSVRGREVEVASLRISPGITLRNDKYRFLGPFKRLATARRCRRRASKVIINNLESNRENGVRV